MPAGVIVGELASRARDGPGFDLPVVPLDGAGVVRNFLRLFLNERTAFVISIWISIITGSLLAIAGLVTRWIFLSLLMLWYVRSSYLQWQFFRSYNRTDD